MRLSLVIPCYREEAALAALGQDLALLPGDEILFVDDGSDDGTAPCLAALAAADARIRVLTHPRNQGVGAALRTGAQASRGEVVVFYDADRSYPLADIERLAQGVVAGTDVVGASPFAPGSGPMHVPLGRRLLSRLAHGSWRVVVGRRSRGLTVFTCAFRAWRGDCVRGLNWRSDGFPAAAEMLARALLQGARVVEVPSTLRARTEGASKMRVIRATLGHLRAQAGVLLTRCFGSGPAPAPGQVTGE